MINEAEKNKKIDQEFLEKVEAKNKVEQIAYTLKNTASTLEYISEENKQKYMKKAEEIFLWLENNKDQNKHIYNIKYEKLKDELKNTIL